MYFCYIGFLKYKLWRPTSIFDISIRSKPNYIFYIAPLVVHFFTVYLDIQHIKIILRWSLSNSFWFLICWRVLATSVLDLHKAFNPWLNDKLNVHSFEFSKYPSGIWTRGPLVEIKHSANWAISPLLINNSSRKYMNVLSEKKMLMQTTQYF